MRPDSPHSRLHPVLRRPPHPWLGVAALAVVLAASGLPAMAQKPGGGNPSAGSGGGARPPRAQALPDTVLAQVADRQVNATMFRVAWTGLRPPARPDSLTPKSAREFLELLIDKEALGARALKENLPWTRRDSLMFLGFVDQLTLKASLDPLLAGMAEKRAAAGDTVRSPEALGVLVRDSVMTALHTRFDGMVASRLAMRWALLPRPSADSSVAAQLRMMGTLPQIEAADTNRTLAWSDAGTLKVSELLEHWKRTDPMRRPRVETAEQIQDLGRNVLFERWLRRTVTEQRLAERPDLAAQIRTRHEFIAVNRLVARDVDAKLPADTAAWKRWYQEHRSEYRLPATVQLITLTLPTRASASTMYAVLTDASKAESLVVQGRRGRVEYLTTVSEETDSLLYRAAARAGTGAVLGPDSTARGWRVARVQTLAAPRERTFKEALLLVQHQIQQVEGERLMRELIEGTRRQTRIVVNEPAVRRLAQRGF